MYKYLDDVNVIKTCFEYFRKFKDMEDFNKLPIPETEYQKQLKKYSVSAIENWLQQFTYDNQNKDSVEKNTEGILELFNDWKIKNDVEYICNSMKFMVRMSRLNIPGIEKHKTKSCNTTIFNIPLMKQYFQIGCLL